MLSSLWSALPSQEPTYEPKKKSNKRKSKMNGGQASGLSKSVPVKPTIKEDISEIKDRVHRRLPLFYKPGENGKAGTTYLNSNLSINGSITGNANSDAGQNPALTGTSTSICITGLSIQNNGLVVQSGGVTADSALITGNTVLEGPISAGNNTIQNVATPVNGTDAVNKAYVDAATSDLSDLPKNSILQTDSNGVIQDQSAITINASGQVSISGTSFINALQIQSLTPNSLVGTDNNDKLVSISISGTILDSGSIQTITGTKTFTDAILTNPTLTDSNGNINRGFLQTTLAGNNPNDQLAFMLPPLNVSNNKPSTYIFDLSICMNDPLVFNGIVGIAVPSNTTMTGTPSIVISDTSGSGSGAMAVVSASDGAKIKSIAVTKPGTGYNAATTIVTIQGSQPSMTLPSSAVTIGNVYAVYKHSPVWNVAANSTSASSANTVLQNSSFALGFNPNVYTTFVPMTSTTKPNIAVYVNTGGYVNPLTCNLTFTITTSAPN